MKKTVLLTYSASIILVLISNLLFFDFSVALATLKWLPLPVGIIFLALNKRQFMIVWKIFAAWYAINFISIPFAIIRILEFFGIKASTGSPETLGKYFFEAVMFLYTLPAIILLFRFAFLQYTLKVEDSIQYNTSK